MESSRTSNWQGEKPKPTYSPFLRRCRNHLDSRGGKVLVIFAFTATVIGLYILAFGSRGGSEHNLSKAVKEYNDYLASPAHQALIYPAEDDPQRANAAIISLVRNSELHQMTQSMRELEETFNRKFKYPWIFFNDEPFDEKFMRITSSLTDAECRYGSNSTDKVNGRGHTKGALGCTKLDSSGYDAGIIRQTRFRKSTIRQDALVP